MTFPIVVIVEDDPQWLAILETKKNKILGAIGLQVMAMELAVKHRFDPATDTTTKHRSSRP